MPVVPSGFDAKIEFFETHLAPWAANTAAIGLSPSQVNAITVITAQARTAYNAAQAAREASKAATIEQKIALDLLAELGGDLVKTIRTFAETNNNDMVFSLAQLPAPAPPTPVGKPATPTDVTATLTTDGSVRVAFKATRAGGTSFLIQRAITQPGGSISPFTLLFSTDAKSFIDETVPNGLASVSYRVVASRPAGNSLPSQPVTLLFGNPNVSSNQTSADSTVRAFKLAS